MLGIAVGQVGMSIGDFYDSEYWEVVTIINAFADMNNQRENAELERTRLLSFYIIKTQDAKNRIKKPSDLFTLPSDKNSNRVSKEYIEECIAFEIENDKKRWERLKNKINEK